MFGGHAAGGGIAHGRGKTVKPRTVAGASIRCLPGHGGVAAAHSGSGRRRSDDRQWTRRPWRSTGPVCRRGPHRTAVFGGHGSTSDSCGRLQQVHFPQPRPAGVLGGPQLRRVTRQAAIRCLVIRETAGRTWCFLWGAEQRRREDMRTGCRQPSQSVRPVTVPCRQRLRLPLTDLAERLGVGEGPQRSDSTLGGSFVCHTRTRGHGDVAAAHPHRISLDDVPDDPGHKPHGPAPAGVTKKL